MSREKSALFWHLFGDASHAVEFARHVRGLEEADSTEMMLTQKIPVISLLSEQRGVQDLGGTMRLGAYIFELKYNSKAHQACPCGEMRDLKNMLQVKSIFG